MHADGVCGEDVVWNGDGGAELIAACISRDPIVSCLVTTARAPEVVLRDVDVCVPLSVP